jgi:hypothetical protein
MDARGTQRLPKAGGSKLPVPASARATVKSESLAATTGGAKNFKVQKKDQVVKTKMQSVPAVAVGFQQQQQQVCLCQVLKRPAMKKSLLNFNSNIGSKRLKDSGFRAVASRMEREAGTASTQVETAHNSSAGISLWAGRHEWKVVFGQ